MWHRSGMSTSSDMTIVKPSRICRIYLHELLEWLQLPLSKEARCEITAGQCMHPKQCFRHASLFLVQNGSNIRHSYVSSVISGTVVEDDVTFARSSGKPKKNHQDIRVDRPYQYGSLRCLFCMKGNEHVGFFVSTLKVDRLSDYQIMIVVVPHHHVFSTMWDVDLFVANYWSIMVPLPFDHEEAGKLFLECLVV